MSEANTQIRGPTLDQTLTLLRIIVLFIQNYNYLSLSPSSFRPLLSISLFKNPFRFSNQAQNSRFYGSYFYFYEPILVPIEHHARAIGLCIMGS